MTAENGPLHLQRGDPLPALGVDGFDPAEHAGSWLLLVVVEAVGDARAAVDAAVQDFGRSTTVRYVVAAPTGGDDEIADPNGIAARRLGAVIGESERFTLAVIVEPRGRVQASRDGGDAIEAVKAALADGGRR